MIQLVMPFVTYSSQHVIENSTLVSNVFINEYLPTANGDAVRVYLYGLYLCSVSWRYDNTLEHFAKVLNLDESTIEEIFMFWQDKGLVRVKSTKPLEIEFRSLKAGLAPTRNVYMEFNGHIEGLIKRPITPNEFKQYYDFLESFHVEPEALVLVVKHCIEVKGDSVGYKYILTVAKRLAYEGARTVKTVEAMLTNQDKPVAKEDKAPKAVRKPTTKKIMTHSYNKGEVGTRKFKTTKWDEVEI